MSTDTNNTQHWAKRVSWSVLALIAILLVAVIGLRIFITTAPGARFIENQVNKRTFGPIESVNISGLSGDPLSAISLESLTIADKDGVWLDAEGIDLRWKPFAVFKGHLWIEGLAAKKTDVLRRPALNPTIAQEKSEKPLKVTLGRFDFSQINLDETLTGQNFGVAADGKFEVNPSGAVTAALNARRTDATGDNLALNFTRSAGGIIDGVFDVRGAPGGPIAQIIQAPENKPVQGEGAIKGDLTSGDGSLVVKFGEVTNITANANWTEASIDIGAVTNLSDWPVFQAVKDRLGSKLNSRLIIDRQSDLRAYKANINVPGLSLDATGNFPETGYVPEQAQINLQIDKPSNIAPMPTGYNAGRVTANGHVKISAPYAFDGDVTVVKVLSPYGTVEKVSGPLTASQNSENVLTFKTDLALTKLAPTMELPIALKNRSRVRAEGSLDFSGQRLTLSSSDFTSGANQISSRGQLSIDGQDINLKGKVAAALKAQGNIPQGNVQASYGLRKTKKSLLAVSADGVFKPSSPMAEPFGELIGRQLTFSVKMTPETGGVKISDAVFSGDRIKAAVAGIAGERIDLTGETAVTGVVNISSANFGEGAQASFVVTGSPHAPALRLDATAASVTVQNFVLTSARLRTEVSDILAAPKGPVQFEAQAETGDLTASAHFESTPEAYIANDINFTFGNLVASGDLRLPPSNIASGTLTLDLPQNGDQYANAALTLDERGGEQGIGLDVEAKNVAYSGMKFDNIEAQIEGTLKSLAGKLNTSGKFGESDFARTFALETPFSLSRGDGESYAASLSPIAAYGDIKVTSSAPITIDYASGNVAIEAPLNVASGTVRVSYEKSGTQEGVELSADNLPITLIPMPGNLADTRGRLSAHMDISTNQSTALTGTARVNLTDWRGFDVAPGQGLSGDLRAQINGTEAAVTLTASSPAGYQTDGQITLALTSADSLFGWRLDTAAPLSGMFTANGAAASVLGLVTPSDAELGGDLSANLIIAGTAQSPRVEGQASGKNLQLEAPELGTRVRNGRFDARFTQDSLTISDVYFSDSDDGALTGSGDFKLGEFGRPIGKINIRADRFRALDRKDIDAKINGVVKFESLVKSAALTGDISINRADINQFVSGNVSVIDIEVEEINRPESAAPIAVKPPTMPISLDLHVRAPRRIFVRSRGLDIEMSVDATIKGTVEEPLFYGQANVLRGGYKIAGKTLTFETGTLTFDGELASAKVNFKAVTDTQNVRATVTITGTPNAPVITLSSTPERPQDEILSALLFGRSATELSALEAAQLAGALAQMSGKGGGLDLLGGLRNAFGINQLSLQRGEDGGTQLVGGRYLAKDVYLQLFSGAGPDQTGAIIDWEIRKNIALSSKILADNDQTLSLKWKRDF